MILEFISGFALGFIVTSILIWLVMRGANFRLPW